MKLKLFIIAIICIINVHFLNAQHFDQYFENQTLRLDYLHIGNSKSETVKPVNYWYGGVWSGTRSELIEAVRLGEMIFEVFDKQSNKLIFSRSYSTLFGEFVTTQKAETEIGSFEESFLMPYPKIPITYKIGVYDRKHNFTALYSGEFDPKNSVKKPFKKEFNTIDLHLGGNPEKCLDILFLPDGYSKKDAEKLQNDMAKFAKYVLECSPFKENKHRINIRAIEGYSKQSGITDPNKKVFKKTLVNSSYNVIDVDRYLMCLNVWKMNEVADDAPYDAILLICNSTKYGGGGIYNFYGTVNSDGKTSAYVIVHELGHSVVGLGDEYFTSEVSVRDFYPEGVEPVEPNLTTLTDFDKKWAKMLPQGTPVPTPDTDDYSNKLGVFEGGGYVAKGVFRPWRNCTMKEGIYDNFCPVCKESFLMLFDYYSK